MVLSTHILSEITATCQKALVIRQGRVVAFDDRRGWPRSTSSGPRHLPRRDLRQALRELAPQQGKEPHMRNTFAIARKELSIYFTTPTAYAMFAGHDLHRRHDVPGQALGCFQQISMQFMSFQPAADAGAA